MGSKRHRHRVKVQEQFAAAEQAQAEARTEVERLTPELAALMRTYLVDLSNALVTEETRNGKTVSRAGVKYNPFGGKDYAASMALRGYKVIKSDGLRASNPAVLACMHIVFCALMEQQGFMQAYGDENPDKPYFCCLLEMTGAKFDTLYITTETNESGARKLYAACAARDLSGICRKTLEQVFPVYQQLKKQHPDDCEMAQALMQKCGTRTKVVDFIELPVVVVSVLPDPDRRRDPDADAPADEPAEAPAPAPPASRPMTETEFQTWEPPTGPGARLN